MFIPHYVKRTGVEVWVAQVVRPPEARVAELEQAANLLLPLGDIAPLFYDLRFAGKGMRDKAPAQHDLPGGGSMDSHIVAELGEPFMAGFTVAAYRLHPHRPAAVQFNGQPDAARVRLWVEAVPMGKYAGNHSFVSLVALVGAGDLNQQRVVEAQEVGYIVFEGFKVPLVAAEVGTVEVGLRPVEHAIEAQPCAGSIPKCGDVFIIQVAGIVKRKIASVNDIAGVGCQFGQFLPVARYGDGVPAGVGGGGVASLGKLFAWTDGPVVVKGL